MAKLEEVKDILGQTVKVGSLVAAPNTKTQMWIGRVSEITPKQLRIEDMSGKTDYRGKVKAAYKNHEQVVCLDQIPESLFIILKQNL